MEIQKCYQRTYGRTDGRTGVGARDACASKNYFLVVEDWDHHEFHQNVNEDHLFDALACKFNRPAVCLLAHLFPTDGPLCYLFSDHKVDHIFDGGSA